MSLSKMIHLPSKVVPFAANVQSVKCAVCLTSHRHFCLQCDRLQPYCLKCKVCEQPRHFLCTDTKCIDGDAVDRNAARFTCKYCRATEKMTEFDDRPPPKCREGSFTSARLYLADPSKHQKEVLKHKQTQCAGCKSQMPLWRRCFYCGLHLELACSPDECLPKSLDLRINPHWICAKCKDKHEVCGLDTENFCLSCKQDQPVTMQCQECSAKFTLACTFPYLCYNTVRLVDRKRLCGVCEGPARDGFDVVDEAKCDLVAEEYRMAGKKREKEAAAARRAAEAEAEKEAKEREEEREAMAKRRG